MHDMNVCIIIKHDNVNFQLITIQYTCNKLLVHALLTDTLATDILVYLYHVIKA